jgi:hypothetical protein
MKSLKIPSKNCFCLSTNLKHQSSTLFVNKLLIPYSTIAVSMGKICNIPTIFIAEGNKPTEQRNPSQEYLSLKEMVLFKLLVVIGAIILCTGLILAAIGSNERIIFLVIGIGIIISLIIAFVLSDPETHTPSLATSPP